MIENQDIICISSIDWDFLWQGHQEIMSILSDAGNRVFFIENTGIRAPGLRDLKRLWQRLNNWRKGYKGIRMERPGLYVFSPLILPFPYAKLIRKINSCLLMGIINKWMHSIDFEPSIIWAFLPNGITLDLIRQLPRKIMIYYCIDSFINSSRFAKKVAKTERKIIEISDLVFVTSQKLYLYCHRYSDEVFIFPFGVNIEKFEKVRMRDISMPSDISGLMAPIVGYIGGVDRWVDFNIVKYIALAHPEFSFVFVGPIITEISRIRNIKNIYMLGPREHFEIPRYVKFFDVGIIPYLITPFTMHIYPTKLNEYLSMGKPVVSTALPEIEQFNNQYGEVVKIARTYEEFSNALVLAVSDHEVRNERRRIEIATLNDWQRRVEEMSALIEEKMRLKLEREARDWKVRLAGLFRKTREKVYAPLLLCLLSYLVIFHSPSIWLIASPLRIDGFPQRADAIVVFGGGVGETGSPGRSTIERARFSSQLFKERFADNLIFSSGYVYIYNDAENMKAYALSFGVPEGKIILEKKANSAFENVKYVGAILRERHWKSIILVTAPYNMRRCRIVFSGLFPDIQVNYVPVPYSQFYDRGIGNRLEQIEAILHEYLGIAYYYYKIFKEGG